MASAVLAKILHRSHGFWSNVISNFRGNRRDHSMGLARD